MSEYLRYSQPSLQRQCLSPNNLTLNRISVEFKFKLNWYICANSVDVVYKECQYKEFSLYKVNCALTSNSNIYFGCLK